VAGLIGSILAGCGAREVGVSGFRPVYPKVTWTQGNFFQDQGTLDIPEVDSLRPTLRWEPVPGSQAPSKYCSTSLYDEKKPFKPFIADDPERLRDVSYDLQIWRVKGLVPDELVYEREGIPDTTHKIEERLLPATRYYWSVRARFTVDGNTRVSEWSLAMFPGTYGFVPFQGCTRSARDEARLRGSIPPLNYYRFQTPAQ